MKLNLYKPVYKNFSLIRNNFYLLDTFLGGSFLIPELKNLSYTFVWHQQTFVLVKTYWRCLEDVFSATFFCLPRRLEDVLKTSWKRFGKTYRKYVLKTSWRRLQEVLEDEKCYAEDVLENKKCLLGYFKINLVVFFDLKLDSHLSLSPFICFNESTLKTIKNAFYFILKALFVLKIFKFLS